MVVVLGVGCCGLFVDVGWCYVVGDFVGYENVWFWVVGYIMYLCDMLGWYVWFDYLILYGV